MAMFWKISIIMKYITSKKKEILNVNIARNKIILREFKYKSIC